MNGWMVQWETLPERLGGHVGLSLGALAVGATLSLPLGIWVARSKRWEPWVVSAASVIQTVPSLALLAVMVSVFGTIGWGPALAALILYSILPMLRSTVTGLNGIDPSYGEAARGIGMTERQMLWQVELPLALPSIVAGVRTATVWTVGMATIAQPVGATSLGNYIFEGLQTNNTKAILVGCVFCTALALGLDRMLRGMERAARERDARRAARVGVALLCVVGLAPMLGLVRDAGRETSRAEAANVGAVTERAAGPAIVVGGKGFTEQYILGHVLAEALEREGVKVQLRSGLGSAVLFDGLCRGDIDVCVDYSGTLWANAMGRTEPLGSAETLAEVTGFLRATHGIVCMGPLGFANSYTFAVPEQLAEREGIRTIADLARTGQWRVATEVEFFARPEWGRVRGMYGLEFGSRKTMDAALMYGAARAGQVDVVAAFSTDGRIDAYGLRTLEDPKQAFPPYDAVLLVSRRAAGRPEVVRALRPIVNHITVERMREANRRVDVDGMDPRGAWK